VVELVDVVMMILAILSLGMLIKLDSSIHRFIDPFFNIEFKSQTD